MKPRWTPHSHRMPLRHQEYHDGPAAGPVMRLPPLVCLLWSLRIIGCVSVFKHLLDTDSVNDFVQQHMEPKGAVAVFYLFLPIPALAKRITGHRGIQPLFGAIAVAPVEASNTTVLTGNSYYAGEGVQRVCVFYRHVENPRRKGPLDPPAWRNLQTEEDWREEALVRWLQIRAYPLISVPAHGVFPGPKYVHENPFGLVLISTKHLHGVTAGRKDSWIFVRELLRNLVPWAKMYRKQLKFSLFTCTSKSTHVCSRLGLQSTATEVVLIEQPANMNPTMIHINRIPTNKYYWSESNVGNAADLHHFFEQFSAGTLEPYYVSAPATSLGLGIRALRGDEVAKIIAFEAEKREQKKILPKLLLFWSSSPSSEQEQEETRLIVQSFKTLSSLVKVKASVDMATVDCARNEHPVLISRLPTVSWFSVHGHTSEVGARSSDALLDFIEDRTLEDTEEEAE